MIQEVNYQIEKEMEKQKVTTLEIEGKGKTEFKLNNEVFVITSIAKGVATFSNHEIDKKETTISIYAQNLDSQFIIDIQNYYEEQGYNVALIQSDNGGDISINDDLNPNGITIKFNGFFDSKVTTKYEKSEIIKVEHKNTGEVIEKED